MVRSHRIGLAISKVTLGEQSFPADSDPDDRVHERRAVRARSGRTARDPGEQFHAGVCRAVADGPPCRAPVQRQSEHSDGGPDTSRKFKLPAADHDIGNARSTSAPITLKLDAGRVGVNSEPRVITEAALLHFTERQAAASPAE
jgi:hypothetical protein